MKKIVLYLTMLIMLISCDKSSLEDIKYVPNENVTLSDNDFILFSEINFYRTQHDLNPLKLDSLSTTLASQHVDYMLDKHILSHDYFYNRFILSHAKNMGEICAYNYNTPQSMLTGYLGSPEHKEILDNPLFTHIGISTKQLYNCCLLTSY